MFLNLPGLPGNYFPKTVFRSTIDSLVTIMGLINIIMVLLYILTSPESMMFRLFFYQTAVDGNYLLYWIGGMMSLPSTQHITAHPPSLTYDILRPLALSHT